MAGWSIVSVLEGWSIELGFLALGGPIIAVLALLSVLALSVVLLKLWQFIAVRLTARRFIEEALTRWRAGDLEAALTKLRASRNPAAPVLVAAIQGQNDPEVREPTVREEVTRLASRQLEGLRSYLKILEVIGSLSPLLGLLGTVLGMIEAFQQLETAKGGVDPAVLSGGIWEALLTTAAGLIVAIPTVAALNGLEGMIERFRHRLEDAVTRVFTSASGDLVTTPQLEEEEEEHLPVQQVADAY